MSKPPAPRETVTFRCSPCYRTWKAEPGRIEDAPDRDYHPWRYYAACPTCGTEREQAAWEQQLLKAWSRATGPRTPEGIAATSANLVGHPTPEEAMRTRFNAMKHGLSARTAQYFPAKPDGYAWCQHCEVDRVWCSQQAACAKRAEQFMLHHAAFEQRNPKHLSGLHSDLQAAVFATVQQILQTIIVDGVTLRTPQWYVDKETGQVRLAEYLDDKGQQRTLTELEAHPLFRPLGELLSRNGLTLADMGMTAKVLEDQDELGGRLKREADHQESLAEFGRDTAKSLEALREMLDRSRQRTEADPILVEYTSAQGGGGE